MALALALSVAIPSDAGTCAEDALVSISEGKDIFEKWADNSSIVEDIFCGLAAGRPVLL